MADSFTIRDVRIFTGHAEIPRGYVHVAAGKIAAVGSGEPPPALPQGVSRPGHTLLPGFIDAHIHADKGKELALHQALRFGVTTVMDMHNEFPNVDKLKRLAAGDKREAADFKSAGLAATIEGGWPVPVVTAHDKSAETAAEIATWHKLKHASEAPALVASNIEKGSDYIKLMHESGAPMGAQFPKPSVELQAAVVQAAHDAGLVVVAHSLALADTLEVLSAGVDGMTHTFYDAPHTPELLAAYKKGGAWVNPTLAAVGSLTTEGKAYAEKFAHDERVQALIGEGERERLCMCMDFKTAAAKVQYAYDTVKALKAEGVPVIVGSDAAGPALGTAWGLSWHHELYLFVKECGFTPLEALTAGTSLTAKCFRWHDRGSIAEGLKADLVLVEGNPLEDIEATLNLRGVWRDGVLSKTYEGKF